VCVHFGVFLEANIKIIIITIIIIIKIMIIIMIITVIIMALTVMWETWSPGLL
jgi:hypothetical protein